MTPLPTGLILNKRQPPNAAIIHGNTSGRFVGLTPVNSATERNDNHQSVTRPLSRARNANSTDASANVAAKRSFPVLPACKAKHHPDGSNHIHHHATLPLTPNRRNKLNTKPGNKMKEMTLVKYNSRSVLNNKINGALTHSQTHPAALNRRSIVWIQCHFPIASQCNTRGIRYISESQLLGG